MARVIEELDVWLEPPSWEDRRDDRRVDASLPATLRRSDRPRDPVTLLDISAGGCRIRAAALRPGDRVWLHLDRLEPLCAHVAWAGPAEAGLEFRQALHPTVLDHLAAKSAQDA